MAWKVVSRYTVSLRRSSATLLSTVVQERKFSFCVAIKNRLTLMTSSRWLSRQPAKLSITSILSNEARTNVTELEGIMLHFTQGF